MSQKDKPVGEDEVRKWSPSRAEGERGGSTAVSRFLLLTARAQ